ncbi:MAG TPA: HAMP domain-containing sensor histidine kinase [Pyrinomonadaceae bacterium]|nr:HAMP domain-containing sensor histidine kinase [Pyrinomonadaceae bacterium]
MKRSWFLFTSIAGLAALFVLLGVLQFNWLSRVSDADAEKMQKRLNSDAERFATDFNREIQNAYFNFQLDAENWKKRDYREFNERYDYWHDKTAYPTLISRFYFIESRDKARPIVYDAEKHTFTETEWTDQLRSLYSRFSDEKNFQPIFDDVPALVQPVHESDEMGVRHIFIGTSKRGGPPPVELPKRYGYLVMMLDRPTLTDKILPDLANKYFADNDFKLDVKAKDGDTVFQTQDAVAVPDASANLFDLSADNYFIFANRDLIPPGEKQRQFLINKKIESRTINNNRDETRTITGTGDGRSGTLSFEIKPDAKLRTKVFERTAETDNGHWLLQLQHHDGSIAAFTNRTKLQNLGVSFGILALIAAGISLVLISAQRAKRLAQRQLDFVSSVSHEFRTPLAVIYSAGENLGDGVASGPEQISRYGDLIKAEGKKLSRMVEQILEFAGARSGAIKYRFSEIKPADVIDDAIKSCDSQIAENGFSVETDVPDELPPINGDREALGRAVQNLIANSIKYGNGKKWIRVSARNGDGRIKIVVEDRGLGISKRDLAHIFEPFYRAKDIVDAQIHGNGLGLSLVKKIADDHGGKVSAQSEIGKGSRFVIEFPQGR